MKTKLIIGAAVVAAAVPAVLGLWGNASFSQDLPVRVPASGQVVPLSPVPSDSPTPTATPSPMPSVDDHGGDVPRDQRSEPGDDRRSDGDDGSVRGDDSSGAQHRHGGDDRGSDDRVSDDRSPDDRGSGHGGSDDHSVSGHGRHGGDD
jgi:hypothetical protein